MKKYHEIKHFHLFCGLGGGAKGFNNGEARVGNLEAKFRCLGGIDSDPAAIRDFNKLSGVAGTVMDLFSLEQYIAFHGKEPPAGWREATVIDIRSAAGNERPNIVFLSAPCKGFSGLLSETRSKTGKYQALNGLTLRGVWLMLEAWKNDPVDLIVFENVPRIASRGRHLLDQIVALLRHYGYAIAETTHDCGELGGLAQSRKRFLLVARHMEKVPPFLYEPEKRSLLAVGDILDRMPLPGDLRAGPMHRVPSLQWKTWVRLAFVEAGSDWRSLNKLKVKDGYLADYLIVPDMHSGMLGVQSWQDTSGTVTSKGRPNNGNFSVADPRVEGARHGPYGVCHWEENSRTIAGESFPSNGKFSVSDPRMNESSNETRHKNVFRVVQFDEAAGTISGGHGPSSGGQCVADPRHMGPAKHSNELRCAEWEKSSSTITGAHGTGQCVADPRPEWGNRRGGNMSVMEWDQHANTVIGGGKGCAGGQMAVADPRAGNIDSGKFKVNKWNEVAGCVIGGASFGARAVADPRCGLDRKKGDNYLTGGHYGVVPWEASTGAVSGSAGHDSGPWSVADPRMPKSAEQLVAVIQALDGTWHRPFTTLELAALQSLVDPEEQIEFDGLSDQAWRERIGNAVPPAAAAAIAGVMGTTLLLAATGQTFMLSSMPIWVRQIGVALSVQQPMEGK